MQVVKIQHQHIICSSPGARSLDSTDGFYWSDGMTEDDV